jgi:hypothetical protein
MSQEINGSRVTPQCKTSPRDLNGMGRLLGRLCLNRLTAAGADAVLPPVPTLEDGITAQAGRRSRIRVVGRRFLPWTSGGWLADGGPQGEQVGMKESFPLLSAITAAD